MISNKSQFAYDPIKSAILEKKCTERRSLANNFTKVELDKVYRYHVTGDAVSEILDDLDSNNPLTFDWNFNRANFKAEFNKARTNTAL